MLPLIAAKDSVFTDHEIDKIIHQDGYEGKHMDKVCRPRHYTQRQMEYIDAIDAMISNRGRLDHYRANVLKYLWRCFDKGDTVTDLKKARWYLNRLIDELEKLVE